MIPITPEGKNERKELFKRLKPAIDFCGSSTMVNILYLRSRRISILDEGEVESGMAPNIKEYFNNSRENMKNCNVSRAPIQ